MIDSTRMAYRARRTGRRGVVSAGICLALLLGCRQEMADQPRYEVYEASRYFSDSMAVRHPVAGTVSRESALHDVYRHEYVGGTAGAVDERAGATEAGAGHSASGARDGYPYPLTEAVLLRGRNRFDIYCSPCHGRDGYGAGIIVRRGLRRPPSFHTERLRSAPPSHFYEVMTHGFGAMYSYASRVSPADRWAIAAYVQALQLSQHAGLDAVPEDTLTQLQTP